jgi:hypothetical protein
VTSSSGLTGKILIVAALALLLAGAADARTGGKVIGNGTLLTGGMYAYAQANATGPNSLSAKVTTIPAQKVLLQWSISCSNGAATGPAGGVGAYNSSTTQKSGQKSVTSPATATLPLPSAKPKSCSISLYAKLAKKAKTTLQILQG